MALHRPSIPISIRTPAPLSRKLVILLHLHPRLSVPKAKPAIPRLDSRQQVNEKRERIEREDERDGPFETCGDVVMFLPGGNGEGDCERDFEQDEGELDPEGDAEDGVLAVF